MSSHQLYEHLSKHNTKTCSSGLERSKHGSSNTWATFEKSQEGHHQWKDPQFTADDTSMQWGKKFGFDTGGPPPKHMEWLRPNQFKGNSTNDAGRVYAFNSEPSLYGSLDKPEPQGIHQYGLGDCWFLAAVSALAERPERIERIIWNENFNANGAFRFYFWLKNKWYPVNIDDRLPSAMTDDDHP